MNTVLAGLEKLVIGTGNWIKQQRITFNAQAIEYKGQNDLVSFVDKQSEEQLLEGLKAIMPDSTFLAEEGTAGIQLGEPLPLGIPVWIVDPLDGTTNFIHGIPLYGVSVGLWLDGEIIMAAVYEPNREELFTATKGGGTFANGKKVQVSPVNQMEQAIYATGFPYNNFEQLDGYLGVLKHLITHSHGVRRMGCASIDCCMVASGRVEGFYETGLKPWDVAAGSLLIKEAGGLVTDYKGEGDWLMGQSFCAGAHTHAHLLATIKKHYGY